jgi:hypothetical protein
MNLKEIDWGDMDWIDLDEDRDWWRTIVNMILNLQVPYSAAKFLSSCTIGRLLRLAQFMESVIGQIICNMTVIDFLTVRWVFILTGHPLMTHHIGVFVALTSCKCIYLVSCDKCG